jgi:broad specificity phosphatase PhoE
VIRASRVLAVLLATLLGAPGSASPLTEDRHGVWDLLRAGGQVVIVRHAATTPGVGDPPGFRLDDCTTQRNLSDAGRRDARELGAAFSARGIPVAAVLSSRWCRCLETARLAFGEATAWPVLDSQFHDASRADAQEAALKERILAHRGAGNLVLVTHGANIQNWTRIHPAQGEFLVLTPGGPTGFRVAGRLAPSELHRR